MTTQARSQSEAQQVSTVEGNSSAATALGFAVIGCLVAGTVGILKAMSMESAGGVFLCLLGSVAAFGLVFCVYLRKD
jgi:hypothetical protein